MTGPVLQTADPSTTLLTLLTFLGILVSVALSVVVLAKGFQGYRRTGDPALLSIAGGILLLSGAPLLLNLLLTTLTNTPPTTVSIVEDAVQLLGLGSILYVIYHTGQ